MILQRIGIIEGDAGFEPRASAPEVCCATNEPPHLQMSHHISRNSLHPPPLSYSAALPLVGPLCVGDTVWDTLSSEKLTQCRYIYSIYIYTVSILYIYVCINLLVRTHLLTSPLVPGPPIGSPMVWVRLHCDKSFGGFRCIFD